MAGTAGAENFCLSTLRDTDRDRYLACLLMPEDKIPDIAALFAFNAEIARIRDSVREALPGEIRMQWWRDVLEGQNRGDAEAHPVANGLLKAVASHRLPVASLINLIDARVFDLYDDPMDDVSTLEGYAGETASVLIQLTSLILNPATAASTSEAAGHAGIAQAIAGLLLLMPLHRRRGQVYVPATLLAATGLDRDSFLAGQDKVRMDAAIEAFAGLGRDHLVKAQAFGPALPAENRAAFLPVSLAGPVLDRAVRMKSGLFDAELGLSQWRRQWILWKSRRTATF